MKSIRVFLISFGLIFTPPPVATTVAFLSIFVFGIKSIKQKIFAYLTLLLMLTSIVAVYASYVNGQDEDDAIKSLKFLFMAFCFLAGAGTRLGLIEIQRIALLLFILINSWSVLSFLNITIFPELIYPPDNNNSAILVYFMALIIVDGKNLAYRIVIISLLFIYSMIADSRALIALLPLLFMSQPVAISPGRIIFTSLALAMLYVAASQNEKTGTWSDVARIEIYYAALRLIFSDSISLIASGQGNFVAMLNYELPGFIRERLQVVHAHNAFFQIFGSYGLLALIPFISFFMLLLSASISIKSDRLRNQVVFLLLLMCIEAVITDSRVCYSILFLLGAELKIETQDANYKSDRRASFGVV